MNRAFAIWMVKGGCFVVLWAVFYGWVFTVGVSDIVGDFISPVAFGATAGLIALYSIQIKRHAPVLNVLPVSQRTVARGFWCIFVLAVPSSMFALEGIARAFINKEMAWYVLSQGFFERWMAAFGMAASWSTVFGLGIRANAENAPARLHVATLAVLLVACGLSTTWVPRIAEQPLEGNLVLAVSVVMLGYSYRRAEDAWSPRQFVVQHQRNRRHLGQLHGAMSLRKAPGPAGLLSVYYRPALLGVACGVGMFVISSAVIAMDRDGFNRNEFADGAPLAISLICFGVACTSPYWLPGMRSLRLLPLSRARLTGCVLAYALTAFLGAPVLVIVGHVYFGWNPIATIAMLWAAAGWYVLAVVVVIRFSDPTSSLVLCGTIVLAVFALERSAPVLIAFGLVSSTLAYAWLYALLGSGKTVYHRASALNAFSPYEG